MTKNGTLGVLGTIFLFYRVCHGFRLTKQDDYFESILTTFILSIILKVVQIGSSLKLNNHQQN